MTEKNKKIDSLHWFADLDRHDVETAHHHNRKVGICGQAPSDKPEFAAFLVEAGIDSISLNPDSVISTIEAVAKVEKSRTRARKK